MKLKWGTTEGAKPPEALLYIMIILVMKGGGGTPLNPLMLQGVKKKYKYISFICNGNFKPRDGIYL